MDQHDNEAEAVTLAKALSVKNRLAGRLAQARLNIETYKLQDRLNQYNASTTVQLPLAVLDLAR
jgi:hypothetical protein